MSTSPSPITTGGRGKGRARFGRNNQKQRGGAFGDFAAPFNVANENTMANLPNGSIGFMSSATGGDVVLNNQVPPPVVLSLIHI